MTDRSIQYRNIVRCPDCGFKTLERMPDKLKVRVFHCPACGQYHYVDDADCCVFCQYGKEPCPEKQKKLDKR